MMLIRDGPMVTQSSLAAASIGVALVLFSSCGQRSESTQVGADVSPVPDDSVSAGRVENIGTALFPGGGTLTGERSAEKTLLVFTVPPNAAPLGPPELLSLAGPSIQSTGLTGPDFVDGLHRYTATLPPTPFGQPITIRMDPFEKIGSADRTEASIDVAALAGHPVALGQSINVVAPSSPPEILAITEVTILSKPDTKRAGANLFVRINRNLGEVSPRGVGRQFDVSRSSFEVRDSGGRELFVVTMSSWTGTPPGVPPGSNVGLLVEDGEDLSAITLILFGPSELTQPDGPLVLFPPGSD
jgi:hypothetical protein